MSETLAKGPEQAGEAIKATAERPKAAEYSSTEREQDISKAEAAVAAVETTNSERPIVVDAPVTDDRPVMIDNALKMMTMRKNLNHVQAKLKPTNKALSKFVHQPLVRIVSDSAAQTVSRPSGMLGGGVMAFVGSVMYLYLAHHIGFRYNYFSFLLFFVGGFAIGLLGELIVHRMQPKTQ